METGSLSAVESGRHFPSLLTLEKIAKHFDVPLQVFFDFSNSLTEEELLDRILQNLSRMKPQDIHRIYRLTEFYKST